MENLEVKETDLILKQAEIVVEEDDSMRPMIVTEDDKLTKNDIEVSAWKNPQAFLVYLRKALGTVPGYSDGGANSMKRAITYYNTLLAEIEEAMEKDAEYVDFNDKQLKELDTIDNAIVESRNKVVAQLERAGGNIKRQGLVSKDKGLVKQAKSSPLTWVVDPFLKAIATICVNAKVQGGKNIEDIYQILKKEYALDKREDLAVRQILIDFGYPIRHSMMDGSEDMYTQYYA